MALGGLCGLVDPLGLLYQFITEYQGLSNGEWYQVSKRLLKILDSALWLIKHFHFKISCLLYDPTGASMSYTLLISKWSLTWR